MLNENIKSLRMAKGLSQEELASRIHVVRQTVSKWEKGLSVPDAEMVSRLAEELGTTVAALLGETIPHAEPQETIESLSEKLAELNRLYARQQEHRRVLWRGVCIVVAVLSLLTLGCLAATFIHTQLETAGVIGGADSSTTIFVTKPTPQWISVLLVALAGAAAMVGIWRTRKR